MSKSSEEKSQKILREVLSTPLGPPPKASSPAVSKSMKANISKNTKPEIALRKYLWSKKLRGYKINYRKLPGSPDICYTKYKIAIFINGCFWHRCPMCDLPYPKKNKIFWENKFLRNKERDVLKKFRLEKDGWKVLIVWECEIKNNIESVIKIIKKNMFL
jgi:DNA mismatch endonuclease, patch repair protein